MSVPVGVARTRNIGSGSAGPFPFNFVLYSAAHLKVTKTSLAGVDTVLTLTTDYSVNIASDFQSATITLVTPLAGTGLDNGTSEILTIVRDPAIEQPTEWPRNDPFPSETHERAADLAVMMIGRLSEKLGRSLTLSESSTLTGLTLPNPVALNFLRWNAAGTALENQSVFTPGALVVSPYIQTLLDDLNAAAAQTTLGISAFIQTLLDDATAATARTTLGVPYATNVQIRSAAAGAILETAGIETAAAFVALTDATPVAVDWDAGINFSLTVTANRQIGNPTNGQPGTFRTILVQGNDATDRAITFAANFLGEVPTITDCDSTRWYLLTIFCVTTSHFVVSSKKAFGT